jgi:hypothetical protein
VVIAQAVEHQRGQLAGGSDDADVAAPPGPDLVAGLPEAGVRGHALHGLDRGPSHESGALLGDPAAVHGGIGLADAAALCRTNDGRPFTTDLYRWRRNHRDPQVRPPGVLMVPNPLDPTADDSAWWTPRPARTG